jgi:hypothetical protein
MTTMPAMNAASARRDRLAAAIADEMALPVPRSPAGPPSSRGGNPRDWGGGGIRDGRRIQPACVVAQGDDL